MAHAASRTPATQAAIRRALKGAAEAGVRVRIIIEPGRLIIEQVDDAAPVSDGWGDE